MNVEQAKAKIKELENYIDMVETYKADSLDKEAIRGYVLIENVNKVASELNEKGYKIGNRKIIGKDVSDIIRGRVTDDMHALAKKMFTSNRKRSARQW